MKLFETIQPDLLENIKELCKKHNLSLLKKIKKEENKIHLKSLLTEAHFGLFFDTICAQLKYNNRIFKGSKTTPDFVITKNSQDIIIEVCRINPAKEDQDIHDAEDDAIEQFRESNPGIPVMGGFHSITIKAHKLYGENGSIALKAKKYGPLVDSEDKPFIICLYLDFISGHDDLDLYHCLYGSPAEFGESFPYKEYYPNAQFHDLTKALYYSNEQMKKSVSGILLRTNSNHFIYFHNFSSNNKLNKENINWFMNLQHNYE